ncbi:MAG: transcriptional regulator [Rhodospirillaceae bacterium]|nr:transcriptional regulator [Rhodospirillaceae bacterium]MBT5945154.1 transcriptional regulator [Rhodospirillaceae bacterium]MBT6402823.1 transcriptional regulator [Rhodospirillaceae bacterium]MBT6536023.1 transcriptional regulator [Rhodospirillaceae bacterium]MBT7362173.1 transcriptional regulator [Rhodospirillaceae bacterium]
MIYRFDQCVVDVERLELRRDGVLVTVEPQVFSLLIHLIENRHHVVSKDDLIEVVWHGRIVSDATLSSRINAARKAVGDNGRQQSVIRTAPRRGFRFVAELADQTTDNTSGEVAEPVDGDASPTGNATGFPVVAVLPFTNRSNASDDEYFSDGLTEDIITELARFRDLRVISRNSTFQYKGQSVDVSAIGKELGAGFVVEGSVRRAGDRLRITAQLVECGNGTHLWAERYDRGIEDLFALQDELTRMIAATLGARLHDTGLERSRIKNAADLDAYDCVLRARQFLAGPDETAHADARDLLERAIELDPSNANAFAQLANIYLAEYRFDFNSRPDPVGRAMAMAQESIELDPQNATAHCWLAIVHFFRGENARFMTEAERALALNPNDAETLANIGHYIAFSGEFERGCELMSQAIALNPLHAGWYHFAFARRAYDARDYALTLAEIDRVDMPEFYWTRMLRVSALGQLGDVAGAADAYTQLEAIRPDFDLRREIAKWNTASDDAAHLIAGWSKAQLPLPEDAG